MQEEVRRPEVDEQKFISNGAVGSYRQFRDAERFVGPEVVITNGHQLSVSFDFTSPYPTSRSLRTRGLKYVPIRSRDVEKDK